jgi:hypothetical protein
MSVTAERVAGGLEITLMNMPDDQADRNAICRLMEEARRRGGEALENVEGRAAYMRIPGSWLHLAFCSISGDKPVAEHLLVIPFRDGRYEDGLGYFVIRGAMSAEDGQVMSCNAVKIMDYPELLEYLGGVWDELWDAAIFELENVKAKTP